MQGTRLRAPGGSPPEGDRNLTKRHSYETIIPLFEPTVETDPTIRQCPHMWITGRPAKGNAMRVPS